MLSLLRHCGTTSNAFKAIMHRLEIDGLVIYGYCSGTLQDYIDIYESDIMEDYRESYIVDGRGTGEFIWIYPSCKRRWEVVFGGHSAKRFRVRKIYDLVYRLGQGESIRKEFGL